MANNIYCKIGDKFHFFLAFFGGFLRYFRLFFVAFIIACLTTFIEAKEITANTQDSSQILQNESCNELCEFIKETHATTKNKNGYFIGINAGASALNTYDKLSWIPTIGLTFGVHSFFTPYIGVRGYIGADMGFGRYDGLLGMLSLGIDTIAEFSLNRRKSAFLGGFVGFGVDGYFYYDTRAFNNFSRMEKNGGFFMQMGVTVFFLRHNRLNIITRVVPARNVADFSSAIIGIGQYSYTF